MEERTTFIIPQVDQEDVLQEGQILKLLGKTPNHSIIRKRMGSTLPVFDFSTELPLSAEPIPWRDYNPDPEVILLLADWALDQSADIQNRIFDFLESPSSREADQLIEELIRRGLAEETPKEKRKELPLRELILKELKRRTSMTLDEILELSYLIISKRPAAALRTALRRLINSDLVIEKEGKYYAIS